MSYSIPSLLSSACFLLVLMVASFLTTAHATRPTAGTPSFSTYHGTLCPLSFTFDDFYPGAWQPLIAELVQVQDGQVRRLPLWKPADEELAAQLTAGAKAATAVTLQGQPECDTSLAMGPTYYRTSCDIVPLSITSAQTSVPEPEHGQPGLCDHMNGVLLGTAHPSPLTRRGARALQTIDRAVNRRFSFGFLNYYVVWANVTARSQPVFGGRPWAELYERARSTMALSVENWNAQSYNNARFGFTIHPELYETNTTELGDHIADVRTYLTNLGKFDSSEVPAEGKFNRIVVIVPSNGYSWAGLAVLPGDHLWIQDYGSMTAGVMIHEGGHNFRLPHSRLFRAAMSEGHCRHSRMGAGGTYEHFSGGSKYHMHWLTEDAVVRMHPAGAGAARDCHSCVSSAVVVMEPHDAGRLPSGVPGDVYAVTDTAIPRKPAMALQMTESLAETRRSSTASLPHEMWATLKSNSSASDLSHLAMGLQVYWHPFSSQASAEPNMVDMTPGSMFPPSDDADIAPGGAGVIKGNMYWTPDSGATSAPAWDGAGVLTEVFAPAAARAALAASSGALPSPELPNATVLRARYIGADGVTMDGMGCDAQGCESPIKTPAVHHTADLPLQLEQSMPLQSPSLLPRPWLRLSAGAGGSATAVLATVCDEDDAPALPAGLAWWLGAFSASPMPWEVVRYGAEPGAAPAAGAPQFDYGAFTLRMQALQPDICGAGKQLLVAAPFVIPPGVDAEAVHIVAGVEAEAKRARRPANLPANASWVGAPQLAAGASRRVSLRVSQVGAAGVPPDGAEMGRVSSSYWAWYMGLTSAGQWGRWSRSPGLRYNGKPVYFFVNDYLVWDAAHSRWGFSWLSANALGLGTQFYMQPGSSSPFDMPVVRSSNGNDAQAPWRPLCSPNFVPANISGDWRCLPCSGSTWSLDWMHPAATCWAACPAGQAPPTLALGSPGASAGLSCHDCVVGTFKTEAGGHSCSACPAGTTTAGTGATSASDCVAVTAQDVPADWVMPSKGLALLGDRDQFSGRSLKYQDLADIRAAAGVEHCPAVRVETSLWGWTPYMDLTTVGLDAVAYKVRGAERYTRLTGRTLRLYAGPTTAGFFNVITCDRATGYLALCNTPSANFSCMCQPGDTLESSVHRYGVACECPAGLLRDPVTGTCEPCPAGQTTRTDSHGVISCQACPGSALPHTAADPELGSPGTCSSMACTQADVSNVTKSGGVWRRVEAADPSYSGPSSNISYWKMDGANWYIRRWGTSYLYLTGNPQSSGYYDRFYPSPAGWEADSLFVNTWRGATNPVYTCQEAGRGFWLDGEGQLHACPAGTASSRGATSAAQCDQCRAGWGTDGSGGCRLCNAGEYSKNGVCVPCGQGAYSFAGASECTCMPGWQGAGGVCTDVNECVAGAVGELMCGSVAKCQNYDGGYKCACPAGTVPSAQSYGSCERCAAGYYRASSSASICTKCPLGQYSAPGSEGLSACMCPGGVVYSAGLQACAPIHSVTLQLRVDASDSDALRALPAGVLGEYMQVGSQAVAVGAPGSSVSWYSLRSLGVTHSPLFAQRSPATQASVLQWMPTGGGRWVLRPVNSSSVFYAYQHAYPRSGLAPAAPVVASGDDRTAEPWYVWSRAAAGPLPTAGLDVTVSVDGPPCALALLQRAHTCPAGHFRATQCGTAWLDAGSMGLQAWQAKHCSACATCSDGQAIAQRCLPSQDTVCQSSSQAALGMLGEECSARVPECGSGLLCGKVASLPVALPSWAQSGYRCVPAAMDEKSQSWIRGEITLTVCAVDEQTARHATEYAVTGASAAVLTRAGSGSEYGMVAVDVQASADAAVVCESGQGFQVSAAIAVHGQVAWSPAEAQAVREAIANVSMGTQPLEHLPIAPESTLVSGSASASELMAQLMAQSSVQLAVSIGAQPAVTFDTAPWSTGSVQRPPVSGNSGANSESGVDVGGLVGGIIAALVIVGVAAALVMRKRRARSARTSDEHMTAAEDVKQEETNPLHAPGTGV